MVGNGGFGNGVKREIIFALFSRYGEIINLVMKEKQPYCFLSYCNIDSAKLAFEDLHGKVLPDQPDKSMQSITLYLAYTTESEHVVL